MKSFKQILSEERGVPIQDLSGYEISIEVMERAAIKYASQVIDTCADEATYEHDTGFINRQSIMDVKDQLK